MTDMSYTSYQPGVTKLDLVQYFTLHSPPFTLSDKSATMRPQRSMVNPMSTAQNTTYRAAIDRVMPYSPGKPIEEVARELGLDPKNIIKLASNENPLGPRRWLSKRCANTRPTCASIRTATATSCACHWRPRSASAGNNSWSGRGSDEIMHMLSIAYLQEGDEVVMGDPPFSMYEISTLLMGATPVKVPLRADYAHDLEAMAAAVTPRTKLLYLANPHNPTGAMNTAAEVETLLARVPEQVLVVLDEAYYEYAVRDDYPHTLEFLRAGKNVLIMRTFSKIYALAGLRIGYAICLRPAVLQAINQVREPFNVANLAQWAAIASLQDPRQVTRSRAVNEAGKAYLYAAFTRMGLPYVPTQANFILVDTLQPCREVFGKLLREGVIVRTGDIFGYPTKIRVTIGTEAENARFIDALERVLG